MFKQVEIVFEDRTTERCWIPSLVANKGTILLINGKRIRVSDVYAGGEYDEQGIKNLFSSSPIYTNIKQIS